MNAIEIRRPIFILGHWRSGTTLLHELMSLDGALLSPTTFQCFNPQRFLLTRTPAYGEAARPAGDVVVTTSSPQEEEFALLCAGAVSLYEAFLFPNALQHADRLCDPDCLEPADADFWDATLMSFLRAVSHAGGHHKRLLLKSPSNSFRVPRLRRLFPDAVFIHLTRDVEAVRASTVRMWETMWHRYAIGRPLIAAALEANVSRVHESLEMKLRQSIADLPVSSVVTVSYDELVADAPGALARLYRALELGDCGKLSAGYTEYLANAQSRRASGELRSA